MNIIKKQISYNRTKRTLKPVYIVVHDTGNSKPTADAEHHFTYFNTGDRSSSADFFVDDKEILQVNDYNIYYSWHCGSNNASGINNKNSIGVEICINSDGNYNAAFNNAVELVKILMKELNIDANHVVRHYDVSKKVCPGTMYDNGSWTLWKKFKEQISSTNSTDNASILNSIKANLAAALNAINNLINQ